MPAEGSDSCRDQPTGMDHRFAAKDGRVPYAFLGLALAGAVAVANAYRPVRVQPLSTISCVLGVATGEFALQNIVLSAAVAAGLWAAGALAGWAGWLGLAVAVADWLGLAGLAVAGLRSGTVVQAALTDPAARLGFGADGLSEARPCWARWWRVLRAVPLRAPGASVVENVDYWGDGIRRHRLDVIGPAVPVCGAPVLVYIHGGAWIIGNKRQQGRPMVNELVSRGWICVSINYRLSPHASWPAHVVDCKRAIAWVKAHIAEYGGDPDFVVVSGGSAGGQLCALVALTPGEPAWQPGFEDADTSVRACIPLYGVMDMTGGNNRGRYGSALVRLLETRVLQVPFSTDRAVFEAASPLRRVHPDAPPFFVLHGTNDTLVPVEDARRFVAALRAVSKAPVAYAELPLAQHCFDLLASWRCRAAIGGVVAFLEALRRAPGSGSVPADSQKGGEGAEPDAAGVIRWLNRCRPATPRSQEGTPRPAPAARSARRR